MARVVIIGIDGLDADLLRVYGPSLPNLRCLMLESPFLELKSCFPPESDPAWASIYTGLNPANHGILSREYYVNNTVTNAGADKAPAYRLPAGEAFWDIAGRAGKRVCIVNARFSTSAGLVNVEIHTLPPLEFKGNMHQHQPGNLCSTLYAFTEQQVERGLELFQREPWDIFFLQLDALDYVQHVLWRYSDPGDPAYPGRNKHSGRILDFYRLFDHSIGQFRSLMERDCILLVVSAHGHGRSCTSCLHLNEWLRSQELLLPKLRSLRLLNRHYLAERAKQRSAKLLAHFYAQDMLPHANQWILTKDILDHSRSRASILDEQATIAQVVDLARLTPFGGIKLNLTAIERKGKTYEQVRQSLLQGLAELRLKGSPVFNWVSKREDIYSGKYVGIYPDILFELRSDFGVSTAIYTPLATSNARHQVISGDHRMYGVLLIGNMPAEAKIEEGTREPTIMDVAPTVLNLVDVASAHHDGQGLIFPCSSKMNITY